MNSSGALWKKETNNWIGPIVKHVWNVAIHVFGFVEHNSLPLGLTQAFISIYSKIYDEIAIKRLGRKCSNLYGH